MARPHVSDDLTQVVEEIHHDQKGRKPASFEDALETVVQLANESLQEEGWYPGKYAGKAVNRVLGQQGPTQSPDSDTAPKWPPQSPQPRLNPDTQAIFKQVLSEDCSVTIPEAECTALGITPGDLLQVIAYPTEPTNGTDNDQ
jgi:hypothetical protein